MIEQQTEAWFLQRIGKVTASRIGDLMTKTKSGYSASRANYMAQLLTERLTGQPQDTYQSAAMLYGIETEPLARSAYEFVYGESVELSGFVDHPQIEMAGASPDGLVSDDGLTEFKCPNTATHIETLLTGKIDKKYILQCQFQMACTNRQWCDLVSFDNRLPVNMQLWSKRIERDDDLIADIESEIRSFLDELDKKIKALNDKYGMEEAA